MLNGALFYFSLSLFIAGAPPVTQAEFPVVIVGNMFFSSSYLTRGTASVSGERDVGNLINRILDQYAEAGFPFCRVRPKYAGPPDTMGTLRLAVDEGPRVRIADYIFRIRGKTNDRVLRKWTRIRTGQYFSRRETERVKGRILGSGLFRDYRDQIVRRDDEYYFRIDLEEESSDYLSAGGSLAQTDAYFFGALDSRNLLGTLRELHAQYEYQKLFRITYSDPILILPQELKLDFSLSTSDLGRLVSITGQLTAPVGDAIRISILTGREIVSYSDPDQSGYQNNLLGLGLGCDPELDFIRSVNDVGVEYLFRDAPRVKVKYDGRLELFYLTLKPHYWWTRTDRLEYFDYFRVGGAKTVRGYLEEEIIAREVFWINAEYNKFICFPLFDLAYADGRFYYAFGLGLAARTSLGNATLALAWPKDGDWRDGKVHFIIEKSF